jgi:hypothetical protein
LRTLDFAAPNAHKSSHKVSWFPSSRYAEWRRHCGVVFCLNDNNAEPPPERLLQAIWFHQRIRREELVTLDGQRLQVLHPGFWNRQRGPDFQNAMLRFSDGLVLTGDVELDLRRGDWQAHRHHVNPDYRKVILHVVWQAPSETVSGMPTLAMEPFLDASLPELGMWLGSEAATLFPQELLGRCCSPLRTLSDVQLCELVRQASAIRLHTKASQFQARARQVGWEQALWEGLFRALGYKQNIWPMQRLGELRPKLCGDAPGPLELQARLLGVGGLLPQEMTRRRSAVDRYVRRLWDSWWREREKFSELQLPPALWKLSGQRPANHPERRVALAAHWLRDPGLLGRIEQWATALLTERQSPSALLEVLQVEQDEFWSWHWTMRSARLTRSRPLLGDTRATDLAMNAILPWLWMRAGEGKNDSLRQQLENRYFGWHMAEDNTVLRLARRRLLGTEKIPSVLRDAASQQGLLQIVKDFCEHSNSMCDQCQFPTLVRQITEPVGH